MLSWKAIEGEPIRKFLETKIDTDKSEKGMDLFEANKYLAEDRIMCL